MEIFDIVDEKGIPTGETIERTQAHEKGVRHRTAHIVYMYTKHVDAKKLTLQKEEVECVEWFDMEKLDIALQPPRDQRFCVPMEGFRIAKRWWESRR